MLNITFSMILCVWFDYHILCAFPAAQIRFLANTEMIGYVVLLLGYGEDFSNRAREITHTICYANGHTNQPFFGVIHAVSTTDA
ncbi:hypothetical protein BVZ23_28845 [Klebsiella variicola]|nr:hypothetical protein BVZ23_28845 [Klebsiella variicola]